MQTFFGSAESPALLCTSETKPVLNVKRRDEILITALRRLSLEDPEYWAFKTHSVKDNETAYFQYPATMIPRMQGALIDAALEAEPNIKTVFDPFVGSGTTLVEAAKHHMSFIGFDINPLAILLSRVKAAPVVADIQERYETLLRRAGDDTSEAVETSLQAKEKWFTPRAQLLLSRLRRAVHQESEYDARCLFWICLAEAARLGSNTRTTTFKLHMRTAEDIASRDTNMNEIICSAFRRGIELYRIGSKNRPVARPKNPARVYLHDVRHPLPQEGSHRCADLLVSSPPYGDNKTTVTYGQHSYLPLHWLDLEDIDPLLDRDWLKSTHELDSRSLGGLLVNWKQRRERILDLSPACKKVYEDLKHLGGAGSARLISFFSDVDQSFNQITSLLNPNALLFWTVGNRTMRGIVVPTDDILTELLGQRGIYLLDKVNRQIHMKRMPSRNCAAATMTAETLLVMRNSSRT